MEKIFSYEQLRELNELEVMIYNYVVSHSEEVVGITIRDLAARLHVSSTTILRFCSKVGCEGYSEFKYRFKEYLEKAKHNDAMNDYTMLQDFFKKVENNDFHKEIRKAAEIVCCKESIIFIGMGTSGTMGKYGARYLSNLGKMRFVLMIHFIRL